MGAGSFISEGYFMLTLPTAVEGFPRKSLACIHQGLISFLVPNLSYIVVGHEENRTPESKLGFFVKEIKSIGVCG